MKKLTKKEKILYTIVKMNRNNDKVLRYEDVLVNVFNQFPKDFQIRFYPQYPDTDTIRRALYQLIPEGFIRISNRNCSLTQKGKLKGQEMINIIDGEEISIGGRRDFNYNKEIKRLLSLEGFQMFLKGEYEEIIDQDFYEFFRTSVRTNKLEFKGKIKQTNEVIETYKDNNAISAKKLYEYSSYLENKFQYIFEENKYDD